MAYTEVEDLTGSDGQTDFFSPGGGGGEGGRAPFSSRFGNSVIGF